MSKIATKESWENYPIDTPKRIKVDLIFTQPQFEELIKGLIPRQMENKWFIYYEDEWIYFHRSWTGFGVYKAKLEKNGSNYLISEFWVEINTVKYRSVNDSSEIENFIHLITVGLLNEDVGQFIDNQKNQTRPNLAKKWSLFGNMIFSIKKRK